MTNSRKVNCFHDRYWSSPFIDDTILLHVSDMGDAGGRTGENAPFMLVGGGSDELVTARSLNLEGTDYKNLLDTVVQAAGVDANESGYPAHGDGLVGGIIN
jgi:hypothetical protein